MAIDNGIYFEQDGANVGDKAIDCVIRLKGKSGSISLTWTYSGRQTLVENYPPTLALPPGGIGVVFQFDTVSNTAGGTATLTVTASDGTTTQKSLLISKFTSFVADQSDIEIMEESEVDVVEIDVIDESEVEKSEILEDNIISKGIPISLAASSSDGQTVNDTALISIQVDTSSLALTQRLQSTPILLNIVPQGGKLTTGGFVPTPGVVDPLQQVPHTIETGRTTITFPLRANRDISVSGQYYILVSVNVQVGNRQGQEAILVRFDKL